MIFKLSLQEIGPTPQIHDSNHESVEWPGPVMLGNPKPLDCNIQGIRFLPQGKFYPLPCGLVGRALGTTVFVKIQTALGFDPTGGDKKFLEWTWKTICREWPVASSAPRVSRLNDSRLTNLTIDFSTKHDFQTFASRNRPNSSNSTQFNQFLDHWTSRPKCSWWTIYVCGIIISNSACYWMAL